MRSIVFVTKDSSVVLAVLYRTSVEQTTDTALTDNALIGICLSKALTIIDDSSVVLTAANLLTSGQEA